VENIENKLAACQKTVGDEFTGAKGNRCCVIGLKSYTMSLVHPSCMGTIHRLPTANFVQFGRFDMERQPAAFGRELSP
jgi:hypothetical protein